MSAQSSYTIIYLFTKDYSEILSLLSTLDNLNKYTIIKTKCEGPTPFAFHVAKTPTLIMYDNKKKMKELRRSYGTVHIVNLLKELLK